MANSKDTGALELGLGRGAIWIFHEVDPTMELEVQKFTGWKRL